MPQHQPAPFTILRNQGEGEGGGATIASDGHASVIVHGAVASQARVFMARAISGISTKPVAEVLLPLLNEFCGRLLSDPHLDARAAADTLRAFAGMIRRPEPEQHESLAIVVGEIDIRIRADFDRLTGVARGTVIVVTPRQSQAEPAPALEPAE